MNIQGRFYIVGVGPGDPELITRKAVRIIEECPVVCVPKGRDEGKSVALSIAEKSVSMEGKEILEVHFPMEKIRPGEYVTPRVKIAWREAAHAVLDQLRNGKNVAFPVLGDPTFYGTAFYLVQELQEMAERIRITVISGVSSIGASAASAGIPLCLGDERVAIVPATYEEEHLLETLRIFDTVVFMKVHNVIAKMLDIIERMGLMGGAVIIEKSGMPDERVIKAADFRAGDELHYFSTMIVRKR
ncbi:MAG: precorrin-2 C(20)-methyltransferase [Nitrospirae bacterium]|nr:precorrin-2 C(20)-methyltransferase [Nitrospirota bacterium]